MTHFITSGKNKLLAVMILIVFFSITFIYSSLVNAAREYPDLWYKSGGNSWGMDNPFNPVMSSPVNIMGAVLAPFSQAFTGGMGGLGSNSGGLQRNLVTGIGLQASNTFASIGPIMEQSVGLNIWPGMGTTMYTGIGPASVQGMGLNMFLIGMGPNIETVMGIDMWSGMGQNIGTGIGAGVWPRMIPNMLPGMGTYMHAGIGPVSWPLMGQNSWPGMETSMWSGMGLNIWPGMGINNRPYMGVGPGGLNSFLNNTIYSPQPLYAEEKKDLEKIEKLLENYPEEGEDFPFQNIRYAPYQLLVIFKPGTLKQDTISIHETVEKVMQNRFQNNSLYIKPHSGWPEVECMGCSIDLVILSPSINLFEVIGEYAKQSRVFKAEPNIIPEYSIVPNDPYFSRQWNMFNPTMPAADINAVAVWDEAYVYSQGLPPPKSVAIIDTGVDITHPDLIENVESGYDFTESSIYVNDRVGHGTAVAGLIGAVGNNGIGVTGVNWTRVNIVPMKASNMAEVVLAMEYAIKKRIEIINASWTINSSRSLALELEIIWADNEGILFITGAGNNSTNIDIQPQYPASYPERNIISVAATNNLDHLAYFSNYGIESVDLGAPGQDIFTTWSRSADESPGEYLSVSGTSFAAPHVAGAAALIWLMYPYLDHLQIKDALLEGGESNPDLSGKTLTGKDLDLHEAINYIESTY